MNRAEREAGNLGATEGPVQLSNARPESREGRHRGRQEMLLKKPGPHHVNKGVPSQVFLDKSSS